MVKSITFIVSIHLFKFGVLNEIYPNKKYFIDTIVK